MSLAYRLMLLKPMLNVWIILIVQ